MTRQKVEILECTLRDGSYVIDFQFTPRDTALICAALENAGFNHIEIGHGLGLNASNCGKGLAEATDEEYMHAAHSTLTRAEWGMFFIPGIGRHEDLELAANYGMNFVRIGTDATEVANSKEYIEHAKKLGISVSANLMKSYALPPKKLAEQAKLSEEYGIDLLCLVDSAGTMLPENVRDYMRNLNDAISVPIGFHSHNNLDLGMANVLTSIECNAQRVDTTLQGMGRGGGNPATEILVTILKKKNIDLGIDINRVMDISQRFIRPLLQQKGIDPIDITSGYAGFHSSYLKTILKYADHYNVDPRSLIVSVCEIDKVNAPENIVEEVARKLSQQGEQSTNVHHVSIPNFPIPFRKKNTNVDNVIIEAIKKVCKTAKTIAKKRAQKSVLNIVAAQYYRDSITISPFVQQEFDFVIGSVEIDDINHLNSIIPTADGIVDIFLVDAEKRPYLDDSLLNKSRHLVKQSTILGYKDFDVWIRSVYNAICFLLQDFKEKSVTICGTDTLALKLALLMIEQGTRVTITCNDFKNLSLCSEALREISFSGKDLHFEENSVKAAHGATILVSFSTEKQLISTDMVNELLEGGIVFDGGPGSVSKKVIAYCNAHNIRVVRPDMRAALAGELFSLLGSKRSVKELMGRKKIADIQIVAGGLIGDYGDVVVDSFSNPTKVVGIADGQGFLLQEESLTETDKNHIQIIEQSIISHLMMDK